MTTLEIMQRNSYGAARKYRAILSKYFYRAEITSVAHEYYSGYGMNPEDREAFFPTPPRNDERALVTEAIKWVFGPREIVPGRFNKGNFPALYTAKEPHTAVRELEKGAPSGEEYVVFDLLFTGTALDMRPSIDRSEMRWPMGHEECQRIASAAREFADGLACYSAPFSEEKRGFPDEKRSCCAIFKPDGVEPGEVVIRGIL